MMLDSPRFGINTTHSRSVQHKTVDVQYAAREILSPLADMRRQPFLTSIQMQKSIRKLRIRVAVTAIKGSRIVSELASEESPEFVL